MTRDDIIRMAREAGMPPAEIVTDKPVVYPVPEAIERFAALLAERIVAAAEAKERQACAKVADEWTHAYPHPSKVIADTIRARGQA